MQTVRRADEEQPDVAVRPGETEESPCCNRETLERHKAADKAEHDIVGCNAKLAAPLCAILEPQRSELVEVAPDAKAWQSVDAGSWYRRTESIAVVIREHPCVVKAPHRPALRHAQNPCFPAVHG